MTVAIPGRGLTRVTINTTKIQEKSQASRAVYEHAVAMGASFGPYCQVCLDAFLPLVAFRFSSDIRYTAAQTVASVFDAACSYGESAGWETPTAYLSLVLTSVARQVPDEDVANMEAVYGLANSLCDSCRSMHLYAEDFGSELIGILPVSEARVIVQYCMTAIVSCLERRSHLASVLAEGPINGDDEKNELVGHLQREEDLLTPLVDSVGYIMKCFGSKFVAIFEENVAVKLGNFLTSGPDVRARLSAVCLFDDCIEHCGSEAAAKFGPPLVEGILNGIHQGNMEYDGELQRAAIYGISQLARYAPPTVLAPQAQHFAQYLCGLLTDTKEESDDVVVYENASSALASLMLFPNAPFQNSGFVKRETLESSFINSLPIREDEDEAKVCHDGLCDLVEHGRINVDSSTLARILQEILADVEDGDEIASAETCNRMRTILLRLQQNQSNGNSHDSFCFANIVSP